MYIEGCNEDLYVSFSFISISDTLDLVYWSCDHFDIHCTYILTSCMYLYFFYLSMCCFFSIFIHMFLI